ncbi:hypothetical protein GC163_07600 [bacterium]|nr:hypothetical protein [bacterium]
MRRWLCLFVTAMCLFPQVAPAATPAELLSQIRAVGPKGTGHAEAIAAVKALSQADATALLPILQAIDGASPLAANWMLGAFETIADRALDEKTLPAKDLEAFAVDVKQHPGARRIAYEWLLKVDPTAADRLIPGMLQDPSAEFRRDAVARKLKEAETLLADEKTDAAKSAFETALSGAVDDDQVKAIIKPLRELGVKVNLQEHFGFLAHWELIGPFDNTDKQGFDVTYPPEQELKFDASYPGKMGEVKWTEFVTEEEYGTVDLTKALAPHKGAITYAATTFDSPKAQAVELRLGTPNAWKLWVNGELVFARDEYHRGSQLDQYRVPVSLKAGANSILLKICQNEQTEDWAQKWEYQIRVCDHAGAAITEVDTQTSQLSVPGDLRLALEGRNE